jgi:hypothetical protein
MNYIPLMKGEVSEGKSSLPGGKGVRGKEIYISFSI